MMVWNWVGVDLKIIHKDDGEVYSQIPDAFETLDDNFCSLGINISFYKTLLDCFGNEEAKEILAALKDCSIDATVRERFNTSQSYKVSLLREISTQEVIDDALLLIDHLMPMPKHSCFVHSYTFKSSLT